MHIAVLAAALLGRSRAVPAGVDLGGPGWTLTNTNGSISVAVPSVPSVAQTALAEAGVIGPPLATGGDEASSWVIFEDWTYTRNIGPAIATLLADAPPAARMTLVCDGLDAAANVSVAGTEVGQTVDAFLRSAFDVPATAVASVRANPNVSVPLRVRLGSPARYGARERAAHGGSEFTEGTVPKERPAASCSRWPTARSAAAAARAAAAA